MDTDELQPATAEELAKQADANLRASIVKLEQQLIEALFSRTTAHFGEHRVLRSAFTKFDLDMSGAVDIHEFKKALEYIGLHTAEAGLPGQGGMPSAVIEGLFAQYDKDGSGQLDYNEFVESLLSNKDVGQLG